MHRIPPQMKIGANIDTTALDIQYKGVAPETGAYIKQRNIHAAIRSMQTDKTAFFTVDSLFITPPHFSVPHYIVSYYIFILTGILKIYNAFR